MTFHSKSVINESEKANLLREIKVTSNTGVVPIELTQLMRKLSKDSTNEIEKKYENIYIHSKYVTNIDILRYKCNNLYFVSKEMILTDVNVMFTYISNNLLSFLIPKYNSKYLFIYEKYLFLVYVNFVNLIIKSQIEDTFTQDVNDMLILNNLPRSTLDPSVLPERKEYETIEDFSHIKPEETIPKTQTSINPSCDGKCCVDFSQLGPLSLESSFWESKCSDRHRNIECNPNICKCDSTQCKNACLYNKTYKKLNVDVEERYTWGIDLFTYRNILNLFPENFNSDNIKIRSFIEKSLMLALSKLGKYGNKLSKGCEYIISNACDYEEIDIDLSEHLLNIYKYSEICQKEINNAYSKGIGIFCIKREGIKQNEVIAPYLGEVYPPYLWFEKQDLIKQKKLDINLPDFYNIMLERMKNDKDGYDILMIDPNSKGNFASRMSHSCNPNCNTVLMVSNNKYTIGMFAMKDISKDEELTFDYNSITEKEKEFYDSVCLCSTFNCRGHYLILSNSMIFTEIVNKFHTFLHRNAILVRACSLEDKPLSEKEVNILNKYSIKSSLLSKAPIWLKRWTALILAFVEVEKELLPIILYKAEKQEKDDIEKKEKKSEKGKDKEKDKDKDKEKEKGKKKEKDKRESDKGLKGSANKKKKDVKRKGYINYNFNDDFIWERKSYVSSTRKKPINDTKVSMSMSMSVSMSLYDEDEKKNNCEDKDDIQKDQQQEDNTTGEVSKENEDKPIENTNSKITLLLPNSNINNWSIKVSNDNNKSDIFNLIDKVTNDDLPEICFESNDFLFLSELNLQLESDYDKDVFERIKYQVSGITEQRIQNLAITLSKIQHIISLIKSNEPPLRILTDEDTYNFYWRTLRSTLIENFKKLLSNEIVSSNSELFSLYNQIIQKLSYNPITFISHSISYKKLIPKIRKILVDVAFLIKKCALYDTSKKIVFYEGLGDILYLYARTKFHFTPNQSVCGQFVSEKIEIRKRDIDSSCVPNEFINAPLDTIILEGRKEYENHYLWGQLVGWFKQTVDKPNASLSAERRGSLSYPEIESFFVKGNSEKIFNFPCGGRENFYSKLIDNTSLMWPVGNDWSFKNKFKIYGTVQFDAVYTENYYLNKIKEYVSEVVKMIL